MESIVKEHEALTLNALLERVIRKLYNALATPGYLMLGEVETPPSEIREKLECLDSKAKIYKKVA